MELHHEALLRLFANSGLWKREVSATSEPWHDITGLCKGGKGDLRCSIILKTFEADDLVAPGLDSRDSRCDAARYHLGDCGRKACVNSERKAGRWYVYDPDLPDTSSYIGHPIVQVDRAAERGSPRRCLNKRSQSTEGPSGSLVIWP